MSEHLTLWNAVSTTPPDQTKAIEGKSYKGTSPKPYWLIQKATETFGPCGIGWGFTIVDERIEDGAGGERMHVARVKVWYEWGGKRGEVEHIGGTQFSGIRSSGKAFTDEDAPKKSVTDALVKALSMIGFAGDIFMGRYDDSKYVADLRNEAAAEKRAAEKPAKAEPTPFDSDDTSEAEASVLIGKISNARTARELMALVNEPSFKAAVANLNDDAASRVRAEFTKTRKQLPAEAA